MNTLLISLGTSPAIVPEAFWLPGVLFRIVHVLTTESIKDSDVEFVEQWFRAEAPDVILTVTRVAGFTDFKSEADHFHFEEVLYRWWMEHRTEGELSYICLSGGFKTMSAAMQKAAAVLGAADVFHVLCDLPPSQQPRTTEEIAAARAGGHLHWIKLGAESGWPQFHGEIGAQYPLKVEKAEGAVRWVSAPDQRFRQRLREVVERSHRIAGAWDQLGELPFAALATWPAAELAWLRDPVNPVEDREWVQALPKVELHCHFGGFATDGAALWEIRGAAQYPEHLPALRPREAPNGWPLPTDPVGLEAYRRLGDNNGSTLLRDPGCLLAQCRALYSHFLEQNICYAEVRCSPGNYAAEGRSAWQVLHDIKDAFDEFMRQARERADGNYCHVNLLLIGTRQAMGDYRTRLIRHLMLAVTAAEHWTGDETCRVVGVDLAGFEDPTTRAHYFRDDFLPVHRCGLSLTVHAGENDDAEGIWSAVFDLSAMRLGHALSLRQSPDLLQSVADRRIAVEMCPYANLQIKGYPLDGAAVTAPIQDRYPLLDYLRRGVPVTVNTDNIGISTASLTDNLLLAARLCPGLTRLDLIWLLRHAAAAAFGPASLRLKLSETLQNRLRPPSFK